MPEVIYKWRIPKFSQNPSNWVECKYSIHSDFLLIQKKVGEQKIYWDKIKQIRIFKPNPKAIMITINCNDKKDKVTFSNQYGITLTKFEYQKNEFNQIVSAIHKKVATLKNIRFVLGDNSLYYINKIYRVFLYIASPVLGILGIGLLVRDGNSAFLFFAISAVALIFADPFKDKKEKEYNPHQVAEKGIAALDL
ncbi:MAG: hypothetical protein JXR70_09645 [Spirochaetales bacterium]|nr:hypothetical protein [Spirochaetales bacterium]